MKPIAVVYTSKTGHTRQYARMIGDRAKLPVYPLEEAGSVLPPKAPIVYLGWIHASCIQGYAKAAKRFFLCAVCGVGLCDTGTLVTQIRRTTGIPDTIPLFTMQGGIDRSKLKGMDKWMISTLTKGLAAQKQRSAQDQRMLELLQKDDSYVSQEHLSDFWKWFDKGVLS